MRTDRLPSGSSAAELRRAAGTVPPPVLVLLSMCSLQLGAALAKSLFREIGPEATVFLRVSFAALMIALLWRPRFVTRSQRDLAVAAAFGVALASMNLAFYMSLSRIPLGVAVTVEFVGPLAVAVAGSRRPIDLLNVLLAGTGILLLAPIGGARIDPTGLLLALLAGGFWAAYILLGSRTGRAFSGGSGLAIALLVGAVLLTPLGVLTAGAALLSFKVLGLGLGVALLSSAIPYSLEIEALRKIPSHVFGILLSLEPAVAALAGYLVLHEHLTPNAVAAMLLVTVASISAARTGRMSKVEVEPV